MFTAIHHLADGGILNAGDVAYHVATPVNFDGMFVEGDLYDPDEIDDFELVSASEAMAACRELAATEGLLVGVTSGGTALAARRLAMREENAGKTIVCVLADTGERYLSMGFFGEGGA